MFHEVDEALRVFLTPRLPEGTRIGFDPPVSGDAGVRSGPGQDPEVVLFLYDVREDPSGRGAGWSDIRDADRKVVGRQLPHRRYQLSYLVSTRAERAEESHRLLGCVLAALINREALPADVLGGSLADSGLPVELRVAPPTGTTDPWDLLAALKITPRACLALVVTAPLIPDLILAVPDPATTVTFGLAQLHGPPRRTSDIAQERPAPRGRNFTTVRIRERSTHQKPTPADGEDQP